MIGTVKELIPKMLGLDDKKLFQIKEYKEKRNKRQNAKYWKLLGQLAMVLDRSVEDLHFEMLSYYSQRYEIAVPPEYDLRGIEYYKKKSKIISETGKELYVYHVFVPSHELNTREFALLLSGLCSECESVGIETLSPDEKAELETIINGGEAYA